MPLIKLLVEDIGLDFNQMQFKHMVHQMMIQQGTVEKNRYLEDGIEMLESKHTSVLEYLLDTQFGPTWMSQQDEAYGDSLLHIAVELHNIPWTKIVLSKNKQPLDLFTVKNLNGLKPEELLAKELKKAEEGINEVKRERILGRLTQIKSLFPESDIYDQKVKKEEVADQIEKKTVTSVFKKMISKQALPSGNLYNSQQRFEQLVEKYPE